jgi:hypothetical protein
VQDHSHKPEEQYGLIERISPGPYLELFARRRQSGWHAWGNEIEADISIPGYPVPSDRRNGQGTNTSHRPQVIGRQSRQAQQLVREVRDV